MPQLTTSLTPPVHDSDLVPRSLSVSLKRPRHEGDLVQRGFRFAEGRESLGRAMNRFLSGMYGALLTGEMFSESGCIKPNLDCNYSLC